jgi:phosphoribosylanthranilate isomerase
MLVKICGITRIEDAAAAVEEGAGALGFVFWPKSPRFIEPHRARAIIAELPPFVTPVGVFVNQEPGAINAVAELAGLGAVQLHGDERPEVLADLTRPVIKAVTLDPATAPWGAWPSHVTLLVDGADLDRRGGTGRVADWDRAGQVARLRRLLLAGGLTPENVAEAIARVAPFGLDVSSGVEVAPGVKDRTKLSRLFAAVRAAGPES